MIEATQSFSCRAPCLRQGIWPWGLEPWLTPCIFFLLFCCHIQLISLFDFIGLSFNWSRFLTPVYFCPTCALSQFVFLFYSIVQLKVYWTPLYKIYSDSIKFHDYFLGLSFTLLIFHVLGVVIAIYCYALIHLIPLLVGGFKHLVYFPFHIWDHPAR